MDEARAREEEAKAKEKEREKAARQPARQAAGQPARQPAGKSTIESRGRGVGITHQPLFIDELCRNSVGELLQNEPTGDGMGASLVRSLAASGAPHAAAGHGALGRPDTAALPPIGAGAPLGPPPRTAPGLMGVAAHGLRAGW